MNTPVRHLPNGDFSVDHVLAKARAEAVAAIEKGDREKAKRNV